MQSSLKILLFVGLTVPAVGTFLAACSDDDDDTTVTPDGGTDSGADTSTITPDSGTADTGTITDAARDNFVPTDANDGGEFFCPLINRRDGGSDFGDVACNACIRTNCCAAAAACLAGDESPNGSTHFNKDGGKTACNDRVFCYIDNCAQEPDAGGCAAMCDALSAPEDNAKAKAMIACFWQQGPAPMGCNKRDDGGILCEP